MKRQREDLLGFAIAILGVYSFMIRTFCNGCLVDVGLKRTVPTGDPVWRWK